MNTITVVEYEPLLLDYSSLTSWPDECIIEMTLILKPFFILQFIELEFSINAILIEYT